MASPALADQNFLIPNGTFIIELIIFAIVLLVLGWYVAPAVGKALRDREEMVEREAEESREAAEKLTAAEARYGEALGEARMESSRIRETARAEGQRTLDELREQAHGEADRIQQRGGEELAAQRVQAMRELQTHVGDLSTKLAGRIVGEDISGGSHAQTVSRFLGELEGKV